MYCQASAFPLNFQPLDGYTTYEWDPTANKRKEIFHPAEGKGTLYPNVLDDNPE
jgi:hypothetical protein